MSLNDVFPLAAAEPPDPFRLRVQKALTQALAQITPANGFRSDIGEGRVFRGRVLFGDDDPLPMLSILQDPNFPDEPFDGRTIQAPQTHYVLLVQGFAVDEPEHPTDSAHVLLADVKLRLAQLSDDAQGPTHIFRFGKKANTVLDMTWNGGLVRPADQNSAVANFILRVTLLLAELDHKPFD